MKKWNTDRDNYVSLTDICQSVIMGMVERQTESDSNAVSVWPTLQLKLSWLGQLGPDLAKSLQIFLQIWRVRVYFRVFRENLLLVPRYWKFYFRAIDTTSIGTRVSSSNTIQSVNWDQNHSRVCNASWMPATWNSGIGSEICAETSVASGIVPNQTSKCRNYANLSHLTGCQIRDSGHWLYFQSRL